MNKSTTAAKTARITFTTSTEHAHERKSDKPCLVCGSAYVHGGGL